MMKTGTLLLATLCVFADAAQNECESRGIICSESEYCFYFPTTLSLNPAKCKPLRAIDQSCDAMKTCGTGLGCALFTDFERKCVATLPPTVMPTPVPTMEPTTAQPTKEPTKVPSAQPTNEKTDQPTTQPTHQPTNEPTFVTLPEGCAVGCIDTEITSDKIDGFCCQSEVCCQADLNNVDMGFVCCDGGSTCQAHPFEEGKQTCVQPSVKCSNRCGDSDNAITADQIDGNCCEQEGDTCCSASGDGSDGSFLCCSGAEKCSMGMLGLNECAVPVLTGCAALQDRDGCSTDDSCLWTEVRDGASFCADFVPIVCSTQEYRGCEDAAECLWTGDTSRSGECIDVDAVTPQPTAEPTPEPSAEPTPEPIAAPTPAAPTPEPIAAPTPAAPTPAAPTPAAPTPEPIAAPTPVAAVICSSITSSRTCSANGCEWFQPSRGAATCQDKEVDAVTPQPTAEPTPEPTAEPTAEPTPVPSAETTAVCGDLVEVTCVSRTDCFWNQPSRGAATCRTMECPDMTDEGKDACEAFSSNCRWNQPSRGAATCETQTCSDMVDQGPCEDFGGCLWNQPSRGAATCIAN